MVHAPLQCEHIPTVHNTQNYIIFEGVCFWHFKSQLNISMETVWPLATFQFANFCKRIFLYQFWRYQFSPSFCQLCQLPFSLSNISSSFPFPCHRRWPWAPARDFTIDSSLSVWFFLLLGLPNGALQLRPSVHEHQKPSLQRCRNTSLYGDAVLCRTMYFTWRATFHDCIILARHVLVDARRGWGDRMGANVFNLNPFLYDNTCRASRNCM